MAKYKVTVKSVSKLTHDVLSIETEKPAEFNFIPGQATEIFLDKSGWEEEGRPFTFTSVPREENLAFTIKTYPEHNGVTNELLKLRAGESLFVNDIFGDIAYLEEGIFIAGGAGITPFISIFKDLLSKNKIGNNKLIFANKKKEDIIFKDEFESMLGSNFINILSEEEEEEGYEYGYITSELIKKHIGENVKNYYVCGPPPMMEAVEKILDDLNVDEKSVIKEAY